MSELRKQVRELAEELNQLKQPKAKKQLEKTVWVNLYEQYIPTMHDTWESAFCEEGAIARVKLEINCLEGDGMVKEEE